TRSRGARYAFDCSEDLFRDLRDDGVSESSQSVQPVGYPMSHSTHVGFRGPYSSSCVTICLSLALDPEPPHLFSPTLPVSEIAVGVGHSPCRAIVSRDGRTA